MGKEKITTLTELIEKSKKWKNEGKKIVFANGVFDILHVGHVRYLKSAKEEGDILIVGINDDKSARLLKGPPRPIFAEEERIFIVSSLSCVDHVFLYSGLDFSKPLKLLQPHIHAKGTDYQEETVPEREVVLSYGGKIRIVGDPKKHSSSDLLEKLRSET
ncbi:adenylyltransferase/cytidyltransferase family protein [Candidatus Calescamantes bacterium]|nr:adenylyltransferase/cytidyltransferase family protein [Candidatus Calescamantes bacterium]